jgi:peptidoglycan L-alanyl-D-glutamate endopeptidase CwlK
MIFSTYKNRYGRTLVLDDALLQSFLAMQVGLQTDKIDIEMTDGWRGEADQDKDKATGHSNASFGHSPHNFGVAFDCAPVINGKLCWPSDMTLWGKIAEVGQSLGLKWGGSFHSIVDLPHFEEKDWALMNLKLYPQQPPVGVEV